MVSLTLISETKWLQGEIAQNNTCKKRFRAAVWFGHRCNIHLYYIYGILHLWIWVILSLGSSFSLAILFLDHFVRFQNVHPEKCKNELAKVAEPYFVHPYAIKNVLLFIIILFLVYCVRLGFCEKYFMMLKKLCIHIA